MTPAAGPTYRQIDFWIRRGYLRPAGGHGTGHPREWTRQEAAVRDLMGRLVEAGLTAAAAANIARVAVDEDAERVEIGPQLILEIDAEGDR